MILCHVMCCVIAISFLLINDVIIVIIVIVDVIIVYIDMVIDSINSGPMGGRATTITVTITS